METFGANFIFLTIVFTSALSISYFVLMGYIITHMDKRYFIRKNIIGEKITDVAAATSRLTPFRSSISLVVQSAKILIGVCLLVSGIVMLVLPGQGLITMLIGLSLLPFPGKNKIEQNLLSLKSVRSSLNWIRIKANKEPFIFN